jgi:transposase
MAAAYSDDLRLRVIAAARKLGSASKAALAFSVSRSTAIKWVQAARDEGRQTAKPGRGHPPELLAPYEAWLLAKVATSDDLTLSEWQQLLADEQGVHVCLSTIWCFFDRRDYSFKKNSVRHRTKA